MLNHKRSPKLHGFLRSKNIDFSVLGAYPRQHELAVALREIGRIERTLFIIKWILDADM